ncbi:hypothetical protein VPHK406_0047 [Vibrio phage K406]
MKFKIVGGLLTLTLIGCAFNGLPEGYHDQTPEGIGVIIGDYGLTLSKEQDTVSVHYEVKF